MPCQYAHFYAVSILPDSYLSCQYKQFPLFRIAICHAGTSSSHCSDYDYDYYDYDYCDYDYCDYDYYDYDYYDYDYYDYNYYSSLLFILIPYYDYYYYDYDYYDYDYYSIVPDEHAS